MVFSWARESGQQGARPGASGWAALAVAALLLLLWLGLGPRPARADTPASGDQAVPLRLGPEGVVLTGHIGHFIDDSGQLGIADIQGGAVARRFSYPAEAVQTAMDPRTHWLRVRVRQEQRRDGDWLLAVPSVAARELTFFGPYDETGMALAAPVTTGIAHPYSTRPLAAERMVFRFRLREPGDYTLYLRARSDIAQVYALTAWDVGEYMAGVQTKRLFDGLSYGILVGMLAYNFMLLLTFRDGVYGYYLLNCLFALLSLASFNGHVARYLLPEQPAWAEAAYAVAPALWIAAGAMFARGFLDLGRHAPWLDRLLLGIVAVVLLAVPVGLAGHLPWLVRATEWASMVGSVLALAGAAIGWRRGYRPAALYILGLTLLFVAVFLLILSNWGVLRWTASNLNVLQLGVAAELVVFSVALGSRIRLMRQAQYELKARASRLAEAAETDPLTGVANRAGLNRAATQLFVGGRRHALMLLDLDQFKPVNDRHGHAAGDLVLTEVARRLRQQVRPQDVVARLGGDEFVILLADVHERAPLDAMATRLLQAVRQPSPWQDMDLAVGASLGIAQFPLDGHTLAALLRAADQAMYHAKTHRPAGYAFHADLARHYLEAAAGR